MDFEYKKELEHLFLSFDSIQAEMAEVIERGDVDDILSAIEAWSIKREAIFQQLKSLLSSLDAALQVEPGLLEYAKGCNARLEAVLEREDRLYAGLERFREHIRSKMEGLAKGRKALSNYSSGKVDRPFFVNGNA